MKITDLIDITINLYFEFKNAEKYGGEGTVGYAYQQYTDCETTENIDELIEQTRKQIADSTKSPVECVRLISKKEYESKINKDSK